MAQSCFLYKSSSGIFGDYKLVQTEWKNNDNNNKSSWTSLEFCIKVSHSSFSIFLSMEPALIINIFKQHQRHFINDFHKHKVSNFYFHLCRKMEFRTYFVYFHTFSYNSKSNELPQSLELPVSEQALTISCLFCYYSPCISACVVKPTPLRVYPH